MFELHFGGLSTYIASPHESFLLRGILFSLPVPSLFLARKDGLTFTRQVREYEPGDVRGGPSARCRGAPVQPGQIIIMVLGSMAL